MTWETTRKILFRLDPERAHALAAGALGGLLAMFVHGIFDAAVWGSKPAIVPWLLIALAVQVGLPRPDANAP